MKDFQESCSGSDPASEVPPGAAARDGDQPAGSLLDPSKWPADGSGGGVPPARVDLSELWGEPDGPGDELHEVRLGPSEVAVIPFAGSLEPTTLHFLDAPELRGYLRCNGPSCVLCRAGNRVEGRNLMPVYVPAAGCVGVLPIGVAAYPGSLGPQVKAAIAAGRRVALLISKPDRAKYRVEAVALTEAMDDGAAAIATFLRRDQAGAVELASIYQRVSNRDLAAIPSISRMLRIKGIDPDVVT